jgi:hypothetical protein
MKSEKKLWVLVRKRKMASPSTHTSFDSLFLVWKRQFPVEGKIFFFALLFVLIEMQRTARKERRGKKRFVLSVWRMK